MNVSINRGKCMSNDMTQPAADMASPNVYTGVSPNLPVVAQSDNTSTPDDKFDKAAQFTFNKNVEGGYTVDDGGPTNYGVTQKSMDAYNASHGYDHMDVADATPDDAKHIARDVYFDGPQLGSLPDRTATAVFDYGYNSGPHQAIKDLQRTIGVTPDGRMGPKTAKAVNDYVSQNGEDALLNEYIGRRKQLMNNLISSNPMKYGQYAVGWAHRIGHLQTYLGLGQAQDSDSG